MFNSKEFPNWNEVIRVIESDSGLVYRRKLSYKIADLLGLSYIGNGAHRVVLDYSGKALKIALHKRGVTENFRERDFYCSLLEEEKVYFAACLGADYGWALFERLKPMNYCVGYRESRVKMNYIRNKIAQFQIRDIASPRNWGLRNDAEPVILDYSLFD